MIARFRRGRPRPSCKRLLHVGPGTTAVSLQVSGRDGPTFAVRPGGSGDVTATHVVWSTPKGSSFVLNPTPDLKVPHVNRLNEQTLASPALVDGR